MRSVPRRGRRALWSGGATATRALRRRGARHFRPRLGHGFAVQPEDRQQRPAVVGVDGTGGDDADGAALLVGVELFLGLDTGQISFRDGGAVDGHRPDTRCHGPTIPRPYGVLTVR